MEGDNQIAKEISDHSLSIKQDKITHDSIQQEGESDETDFKNIREQDQLALQQYTDNCEQNKTEQSEYEELKVVGVDDPEDVMSDQDKKRMAHYSEQPDFDKVFDQADMPQPNDSKGRVSDCMS